MYFLIFCYLHNVTYERFRKPFSNYFPCTLVSNAITCSCQIALLEVFLRIAQRMLSYLKTKLKSMPLLIPGERSFIAPLVFYLLHILYELCNSFLSPIPPFLHPPWFKLTVLYSLCVLSGRIVKPIFSLALLKSSRTWKNVPLSKKHL